MDPIPPHPPEGQAICLPIQHLQPWHIQARPIDQDLVDKLIQDIARNGLIEPIVVDQLGRVLCGHHRLEALRRLQAEDADGFARHFPDAQIPVTVQAYNADQSPVSAISVMFSENKIRRSVSVESAKQFRHIMIQYGLVQDGPGRPRKGTVSATEAVATVFQVSPHTAKRLLASPHERKLVQNAPVSHPHDGAAPVHASGAVSLEGDTMDTEAPEAVPDPPLESPPHESTGPTPPPVRAGLASSGRAPASHEGERHDGSIKSRPHEREEREDRPSLLLETESQRHRFARRCLDAMEHQELLTFVGWLHEQYLPNRLPEEELGHV